MKKLTILILLIATLLNITTNLEARDWDDLHREEKKVYGSEKAEKYPVTAFIIEKEDWKDKEGKDHYSVMAFFLFRYTNYPKYNSLRFLPFWYRLSSKIDNRQKTIIPFLFYYNRIDGDEDLTVSPLYYSNLDKGSSSRSIAYMFWWNKDKNKYHNKSSQFFLPLLLYHSNEENYHYKQKENFFFWFPVIISNYKNSNYNTYNRIDRYNLSLFHVYMSSYNENKSNGETTGETSRWWMPIIPLTYHYSNSNYGHRNLFWIIDWSYNIKNNNIHMKRFWFFPLALWKKQTSSGYLHILPPLFISTNYKNGEFYRHFIPPLFLHDRSRESTYNYGTRKYEYTHTESLVSLFYNSFEDYKEKKWQGVPYSRTTWFPLIPIYCYSHHPKQGKHYNVAWLFDWHYSPKGDLDRMWVFPLYFWGQEANSGYRNIIPPLYISSWKKDGSSYSHFLPLLFFNNKSIDSYYDSNSRTQQPQYTATTVSPLFVSHSKYRTAKKWDGVTYSKNFWFPIVPLYYYSRHPQHGKHINVAGIFDWHFNTKGKLDRFWMMPLLFAGGSSKDGYFLFLPPLFIKSWEGNGASYSHLLPVYFGYKDINSYYSSKTKKYENEYEDVDISPLYVSVDTFRGKDKWQSNLYSTTYWFPIVPLFYRSIHPEHGNHTNIAGFIDFHSDNKGNLDRFWLMPLLFSGGDSKDGYTHLLPPFHISTHEATGENYWHILPLLTFKWRSITRDYSERKPQKTYNSSLISPLLCYFSSTKDAEKKWQGDDSSYSYWFPFIPLYFKSYNEKDGTHKNLAWLIDWKTDTLGKLERFWFMPFIFHKPGVENYSYIFPFYMHPAGATQKKGYHFGLFHYYSWSPKKNILLTPLYYSRDNKINAQYYTHILPLYYSWKSTKSSGRILLPFYVNYEDKKTSLHLTLLGFFNQSIGPLGAGISFDAGVSKGDFYLDKDISFLYNVVKISTRVTIPNPFKKKSKDKTQALDSPGEQNETTNQTADNSIVTDTDTSIAGTTKTVTDKNLHSIQNTENITSDTNDAVVTDTTDEGKLSKKRTFTREDSSYFFGLSLLFGWTSYEIGNFGNTTKRHFRMLPLFWLTWDTKSKDSVYVIPLPVPILWFNSEKQQKQYNIVFPFYGYQREGKSYSHIVLGNLFWKEYNHLERMHEYTALWPIFNLYSAKRKFGYRLFPVWWYKYSQKKSIATRKLISPLLLTYAHWQTNTKDNSSVYKTIVNPLFINTVRKTKNRFSETLMFPIVPIYLSWQSSKTVRKTKTMNQASEKVIAEKNPEMLTRNVTTTSYITNSFSYILPLGTKSQEIIESDNGSKTVDTTYVGLPLFYYNNRTTTNTAVNSKGKKSFSSALFLMFFYRSVTSQEIYNSFLFGLYSKSHKLKSNRSTTRLLYGLISFVGSKDKSYSWVFPIWYHYKDKKKSELSLFVGLYKSYANVTNNMTSTKLLWGLFRTASWQESYHSHTYYEKKTFSVNRSRTWTIPFFYYGNYHNKDEKLNSTTLLFPIVPMFYYDKDTTKNGNNTYTGLVPLFFAHSWTDLKDKTSEQSIISPLFYYNNYNNKDNETTTMWFPIVPLFYWNKTTSYSHLNILGIFNIQNSEKDSVDNRYFLLPLIYRSNGQWGSHTNLAGIIDFGWNSAGNLKRHFFLPLYYWDKNNSKETNLLLFPLLTYINNTSESTTASVLGTYFYSSKSYSRQSLWMLFDRKNYISENRKEYGFVLNMINYQTSETVTKWRLFYGGLVASYKNSLVNNNYEFSILKYVINFKQNGDYFRNAILPFYYYSSDKNGWSFLSPITLSYFSKDTSGDLDLVAGGLLYFRYSNYIKKYDRRMILLGTLWNEVKQPERGYHARGMLWGLLWDYETETERDFSKFSILKGLYKQMTLDGKTKRTFLWIF